MNGRRTTCLAVLLALLSLGASAQLTQRKYHQQLNRIQQEQHQLSNQWNALDDNDSIGKGRINDRMQTLNDQLFKLRKDYIETFPADETTARILLGYSHEYDFLAGYEKLSDEVKNGPLRDSLNTLRTELLRARQAKENMARLVPGAKAPDFKLPSAKGDTVSLYSLLGERGVVLDFWGTWCYWCMKGMPRMREYYQRYWSKVEFVGIDCQDKEQAWLGTVEKEKMLWTQLRNDDSADVPLLYGISCYPTKMIIDARGRIVRVFEGETEAFYQTLDSLYAPKMPEAYDRDQLFDYLSYMLPTTGMETQEDYVDCMTSAINEHIANEEWRQRLHCDFAESLIQMGGTIADPGEYLNRYLDTNPADSLASRVRKAYDDAVAEYGKTYPGEQAPDFAFTDTSGKRLSLKSFLGKTLLIDIWGTWCVPCIEEMPNLEKLQQKYAQREDVHIMSIACDKKADRWTNFLAKHPTSWHQYLITPEGDKTLTETYHVIGIPRFIIVDRQGKIVTPDAMRPSEETFEAYFEDIINR